VYFTAIYKLRNNNDLFLFQLPRKILNISNSDLNIAVTMLPKRQSTLLRSFLEEFSHGGFHFTNGVIPLQSFFIVQVPLQTAVVAHIFKLNTPNIKDIKL